MNIAIRCVAFLCGCMENMNEVQYVGEHLMPGVVGNLFVVLSFVAALFSAVTYFLSTRSEENRRFWILPARVGFFTHAMSVIGIIVTLFYILFNHLYEYKYAWDHLSNAMPMRYIFSCMWEGQEGSFLLWTFWHVILGMVLIRSSKAWEPWVMAVVAMVEVFLASMLIGVYFGDFQFGSNPFILNREALANVGLPWTMRADYLTLQPFQDGRGLNPLLQNYWMTIHPPTLFLGFASTLIPFAYGIAGLWKKDYNGWMTPAIPWSFFGVMILGTGILMGGAWAYEALGFGGFWAWDPVENASLVPWLTLVASAHLIVINQRKKTSLYATIVLTLSTFILVLYSTFLTRSGVLGDSSVHSFVESGILPQLLVYLLFFVALGTWLIVENKTWKRTYAVVCALLFVVAVIHLLSLDEVAAAHQHMGAADAQKAHLTGEGTWIPGLTLVFLFASCVVMVIAYRKQFRLAKEHEEALWSREFWMFIGALVLTLSAIHITVQTSVNVGNIMLLPFEKLFVSLHESTHWEWMKRLSEHNFSAPGDDERFTVYHRIQIPLAFILFMIVAIGQFLKYKNTDLKIFRKQLFLSFVVASGLTLFIGFFTGFSEVQFPLIALMFATIFALLSNADYAIRIVKGKLDHIGASIAHLGFAMLIMGAVISTSQKFFISQNRTGNISELSKEFKNSEDMMLVQGDTLPMGNYFVRFDRKFKEKDHLKCDVQYFKLEPIEYKDGDQVEMQGMYFRANQTHTATGDFLQDWSVDSLWSPMMEPNAETKRRTKRWRPGKPGEFLFTLSPSVIQSNKGNSREPSIAHFAGHDMYTYLKYVDLDEKKTDTTGFLEPVSGIIEMGTPVKLTETLFLTLDSLVHLDTIPSELPQNVDISRAFVTMKQGSESEKIILIVAKMKDNGEAIPFPGESKKFRFLLGIAEKGNQLELTAQEHAGNKKEFIIMTAEIFPQINILWLGCLVMVLGTTLAIRHRIKLSRRKSEA